MPRLRYQSSNRKKINVRGGRVRDENNSTGRPANSSTPPNNLSSVSSSSRNDNNDNTKESDDHHEVEVEESTSSDSDEVSGSDSMDDADRVSYPGGRNNFGHRGYPQQHKPTREQRQGRREGDQEEEEEDDEEDLEEDEYGYGNRLRRSRANRRRRNDSESDDVSSNNDSDDDSNEESSDEDEDDDDVDSTNSTEMASIWVENPDRECDPVAKGKYESYIEVRLGAIWLILLLFVSL